MDLNITEVGRLLNVGEDRILDWISGDQLPCHRIQETYRFNRVEILEWASARQIAVRPDIFASDDGESSPLLLTGAIQHGGVLHNLPGTTKSAVLQAVCERMLLPAGTSRAELLEVLMAREALNSTGIGEGFAIPHPRGPIVLGVPEPLISMAFLAQPVDFAAIDKRPVHTLFVIISPTIRLHLKLLSRLMFALKNKDFRRLLARKPSADDIFKGVEKLETGLKD